MHFGDPRYCKHCCFFLSHTRPHAIRSVPKKGMVVAAEPIAANVGLKILKEGGNAVDAAVAVGFALAVTYPGAGNIGGGGFMVMRFADGTVKSLDYRETAPAAAKRDMYLDKNGNFLEQKKSTRGHLACGVPGSSRE